MDSEQFLKSSVSGPIGPQTPKWTPPSSGPNESVFESLYYDSKIRDQRLRFAVTEGLSTAIEQRYLGLKTEKSLRVKNCGYHASGLKSTPHSR